jgi:putative transposase
MARLTYRYRLYPNAQQTVALNGQLAEACRLYNAAIDERRSAWRQKGISLNYYDQANQLREIRAAGHVGVANFSVCQDVLRRVDRTFGAFFRRVRAEERPGYPRFKPTQRYNSLTFPIYGDGCKVRPNRRLYVRGVGELKVKWHRPIVGTVKTVTLKREAGTWFACFSTECEPERLPETSAAVGIDMGIAAFLVTDTGDRVMNPRYSHAAERRLRVAQRRLARRQKRSRRRQNARLVTARQHMHVANQRRDFHHKTARALVDAFGLIAIEDLNIKGLASSMLAKSVRDAGWNQFLRILTDKASIAGRFVVAVNPAGTTQECSGCGIRVAKGLCERWHLCPACGCSLDRDVNAARNILQRALNQRPGLGLQAPTSGVPLLA